MSISADMDADMADEVALVAQAEEEHYAMAGAAHHSVHFDVAADGSIVPFFVDGEEFAPHFIAILRRARRAEAQGIAAEAQAAAAEAQAAAAEAVAQVAQLREQLRAAGIEPTA